MERKRFELSEAHKKGYRENAFHNFLSGCALETLEIGIRNLVLGYPKTEEKSLEIWFYDALGPIQRFLEFCDALRHLRNAEDLSDASRKSSMNGAFLNLLSECRLQDLEIGIRNLIIDYVAEVDKAAEQWFFNSIAPIKCALEFVDAQIRLQS